MKGLYLVCVCVCAQTDEATLDEILQGAHLGKQHLAVLVMHAEAGIHVQGQLPRSC